MVLHSRDLCIISSVVMITDLPHGSNNLYIVDKTPRFLYVFWQMPTNLLAIKIQRIHKYPQKITVSSTVCYFLSCRTWSIEYNPLLHRDKVNNKVIDFMLINFLMWSSLIFFPFYKIKLSQYYLNCPAPHIFCMGESHPIFLYTTP